MAKWNNWAETVEYGRLEKVFRPNNLADLIQDVEEAVAKNWKLRAVGSGHAWSNLGVPERCKGAVILTDDLNRFLGQGDNTVEVEAGIKIEDLNEELERRGLALENMGDANPQAIAGAISTGTHGSGAALGSLSDLVEGMKVVVVRDDRSVELIDLGTEDERLLRAGRLSLGQLGVIYSITLRVRNSYFLRHEQSLVTFLDERENLAEDLERYRHLEYWVYPYTGKAERIVREIVDSREEENLNSLLTEWFIQQVGAGIVNGIGKSHPERLPNLFRNNVTPERFPPLSRQGPWHKILLGKSNVWRNVVETFTMEYQVDLGQGPDFKNFWDAYDALEASLRWASERKCVFAASPTQIRFTKQSRACYLSHMLYQPTASFSVSFFREHSGAHTWLPGLEQMFLKLGGKPHWGKMYYTEPEKNHGFEGVRAELDPLGIFAFEQGPYTPDPEAFQDY